MASLDAINYLALGISGTNQLGSDTKVSSSSTNYTDGLSADELATIDKNGDGAITWAEFKAAFNGDDAETYWNQYKEYYNSSVNTSKNTTSTTTSSGSSTTKITSTYDSNNKLTGYTETITKADGTVKVKKYSVTKGTAEKESVKTTSADGTVTKKKYSDGKLSSTTTTTADGTSVKTDKKGNITSVSTSTGTELSVKYDSSGNVKSATVNGTKYTNIKVKDDGTIVVKDSDGTTVAKISDTSVITYDENGNKSEKLEIEDGAATNIYTYNTSGKNNGKASSRVFCTEEDYVRTYSYDSNGNKKSSTDTIDGVTYSTQTYYTSGENKGEFKTRTYYDEDGNKTTYKKITYTNSSDGTSTKTVNTYTYDESGSKSKTSKTVYTIDSSGNNTSSVKTDYVNSTITTSEYTDGLVTSKSVEKIENGQGTTVANYTYTYYSNGRIKSITKTTPDGATVTSKYTYDKDGNVTMTVISNADEIAEDDSTTETDSSTETEDSAAETDTSTASGSTTETEESAAETDTSAASGSTTETETTTEPEESTASLSKAEEYSANIAEIAVDKDLIAEMLNDEELSLEEKLGLLAAAKEVDGNVVEEYLSGDDSFYINALKEFSNSDSEYTAEDIVAFQKEYFALQGDNKIDSENWDDCLEEWVAVYEKFAGDSESIETLTGAFSLEGLASKIQAKFDEDEAQALLERLEAATGYTTASNETEEETSKAEEYSANIAEIAVDKDLIAEMLNDEELSIEEKLGLLAAAKEVDGNVVEEYLSGDDSFYINALKEFSNSDSEYTAEDIVAFQKEYFALQGDNKIDSENWDDCLEEWVAVYEKFAGDSESIETLTGAFSLEGLASKIQAKFDEDEAQALLERLEAATGYTTASNETEEETSKAEEYSANIAEIAVDKDLIAEMLNDEELSIEEKLALLAAAKEIDGNVVEEYFSEDDSFYLNALEEFSSSDSEYTAEDVVNFENAYYELQGNKKIDSEIYADCLEEWVAIYEKYAGDSDSLEKLNDCYSVEDLTEAIKKEFKKDEAESLLSRLEDATGENIISKTGPEKDTDETQTAKPAPRKPASNDKNKWNERWDYMNRKTRRN